MNWDSFSDNLFKITWLIFKALMSILLSRWRFVMVEFSGKNESTPEMRFYAKFHGSSNFETFWRTTLNQRPTGCEFLWNYLIWAET